MPTQRPLPSQRSDSQDPRSHHTLLCSLSFTVSHRCGETQATDSTSTLVLSPSHHLQAPVFSLLCILQAPTHLQDICHRLSASCPSSTQCYHFTDVASQPNQANTALAKSRRAHGRTCTLQNVRKPPKRQEVRQVHSGQKPRGHI